MPPEPDDGMHEGIAEDLDYDGDHEQYPDPVMHFDVEHDFWQIVFQALGHGDLPDAYPFNPDASRQLLASPKQFPQDRK